MLQEGGNAVTDELHSSAIKRSMKKEKNEKEEKKDIKNEIRKSEKERRDSKEHSSKHRKSYESEKEKSTPSQTPQIDSSSGNNIPNKNFSSSMDLKNVFEVAAALLTYVPALWMSFPSDLACKYYDVLYESAQQ